MNLICYWIKSFLKVLEKYEEAKRIDQEGLVFIVDEPGVQTRRSFKPVRAYSERLYREYYNGFNCTMDWPAKCQIITAYRKKINGEENILDCPLLSLGIHLIRKIFNILDLLYFEEYMVEFKKYHMFLNK